MINIILTLQNTITIGDPKILIGSRHDHEWKTFDCISGTQTINVNVDLAALDTLYIKLTDREHNFDSDDQTTVQIVDLSIDGINLQHLIYKGTLYPQYDTDFVRRFNPPGSYTPGTTFQTNGTFELDVQLPIYKFIVDSYEQDIS